MNVKEVLGRQLGRLDARSEVAAGEELPELTDAMVRVARYLEEKHLQEDAEPMDVRSVLRMIQKVSPKGWSRMRTAICPFAFDLPSYQHACMVNDKSLDSATCEKCWEEAMI